MVSYKFWLQVVAFDVHFHYSSPKDKGQRQSCELLNFTYRYGPRNCMNLQRMLQIACHVAMIPALAIF